MIYYLVTFLGVFHVYKKLAKCGVFGEEQRKFWRDFDLDDVKITYPTKLTKEEQNLKENESAWDMDFWK